MKKTNRDLRDSSPGVAIWPPVDRNRAGAVADGKPNPHSGFFQVTTSEHEIAIGASEIDFEDLLESRPPELARDKLGVAEPFFYKLVAALDEELQKMKGVDARVMTHPDSIFAGAIGAALWGAFRHQKLAASGQLLKAS